MPMAQLQYCQSEFCWSASEFASAKSPFLSTPTQITSTLFRPRTRVNVKKVNSLRVFRVNAVVATPFSFITNNTAHNVQVKAVVSVKLCVDTGIFTGLQDSIIDLTGKILWLELVSSLASDESADEGKTIQGYAHRICTNPLEAKYECTFQVPSDFGEVGAVRVENEHHKEMYLNYIELSSFRDKSVKFPCNSWVHAKCDNPNIKRTFFTSQSYLPSETPSGLKKLREQELEYLRGSGSGVRQKFDRIYDYDKYNDLGDPDKSSDLARPVLGGPEYPYPRRCRTGRGPTKTDPLSEKTTNGDYYVPRDEQFSAVKSITFHLKKLKSALHGFLPFIETKLVEDDQLGFPNFSRIDSLFNQGIELPDNQGIFKFMLPRFIKYLHDKEVLQYELPESFQRDRFSWFRDEEFGRQTLAGLNPLSIQLLKDWPIKSKLDTNIYGDSQSLITEEIIEREINGFMTFKEAMDKNKLFVLDYHDLLLPYVKKVRDLKDTILYASRTLFFLCEDSTLKPIAIELTRPPMDGKPQWRHVFTPAADATNLWLWRIAKNHVLVHDMGYHQLVSHWLRTHCCMETYVIAANRQLSEMHPIFRLLKPHFRFTMEINAFARKSLINADGIIESCFSLGKYSLELSSDAYDQLWRFDREALPADLIWRGMAVEDPKAKHGLKLTIEDYPYANDGLILWDAIKSWVTEYVNHYYQDETKIKDDKELQSWWNEFRTKAHEDKQDEPWWPVLDTTDSLIQTLSTIIWVASGHHAAVNFGQYEYAGYFPNRPTIARTKVPIEDPTLTSFQNFLSKPEDVLLDSFPDMMQAIKVLTVLDVLSDHSPDEEYIGKTAEPAWLEDPNIKGAFERFKGKLESMEGVIDTRNADFKLKNRRGAGVVPYELLKPKSDPGVTGKGVPNSVSI